MKNEIAFHVAAGKGLKLSEGCNNRSKIKEKRNIHMSKSYNIYSVCRFYGT